MDPSLIRQIIILLILLLLSAFFSSAETALTTVNRVKLRTLADQGNARAARLLSMRENPGKMLSAILIGNNIVNLSASSLTTTLAIDLASRFGAGARLSTFIGLATGLLTLLVLVFGEITPKTAAVQNDRMALLYVNVIYWLTIILTPIIFIVNAISSFFCRLFGIDTTPTNAITELELRTIVNVSQEEGVIEPEEKDMIHNVVDFGDSVAKDIMIPRIDMVFASTDMSYDELIEIFVEYQYSRLPVYEETKDKVIGILNLKDLFFCLESNRGREIGKDYGREFKQSFDLRSILRKPYFTYEFQKTSVLMEEMRKNSITFAIVLDEYGSTAGLVTLEDLLEEIVGDIRDEFDEEEQPIRPLGDNEYEIDGSTKLDDINDYLGTDIESEDYDSIGGYMIELLGHFPEEGETVMEGDYLYSVKKMDSNRIELIYLRINK